MLLELENEKRRTLGLNPSLLVATPSPRFSFVEGRVRLHVGYFILEDPVEDTVIKKVLRSKKAIDSIEKIVSRFC